ncbi:MFS transporter [Paracoccus sp. SCSIO 75233]|uniref:MFS transporter n=1 Tax=Paracoccus sp. SCSIO 75233 TaxID=3017782 RepID=UPI0022F00A45|nr:MFS transporter [Paracoccus sp. SCSIO 75233]WBU53624.1 MFS transporter [Paracoccus sp. SCSIO 75233]
MSSASGKPDFFDQPKAVWATAFACVVGFMSIGLVDPILTSIAEGLNASPSQVSLLFSSYFLVTSVMMLVTGWVSSRIGGPNTILLGTALIVVFAALAGLSNSVAELVMYRAGWGLGNALFVATALSVIVATSRGGMSAAILMYEAALGLGISAGPLLGAALGTMSWRYPFFGTAALMCVAFLAVYFLLPPLPKPAQKTSLSAPIKALGDKGLLITAVAAFFYNYGFFTVLAFVPFVLNMSPFAVGMIFFGWGLFLAVFSVLIAPRLQARFSSVQILSGCLLVFALLLCVMAFAPAPVIAGCVVFSGALMGICNTVFTELALGVSDHPHPVASAGYNFVRWFSGVIAPLAAPHLAESFGTQSAFFAAVIAAIVATAVLVLGRNALREKDEELHVAVTASKSGIFAALEGSPKDEAVLARAAALAKNHAMPVFVLHVRTYEIAGGMAVFSETVADAANIVNAALTRLRAEGVKAEGDVIEAAAAHLVPAIDAQLTGLSPKYVVISRGEGGDLSHGSTVENLLREMPEGPELAMV